ncbi:MAG: hypothetical protein JNK63_09725 [Chthonomonas sp.]|nr:hypothetical protein [Chthonomonas sp.]
MRRYFPLIVCAFAIASGFVAPAVEPEVRPKAEASGLHAHETHASASLLGQFRTSITSWLWLRTDLYLHNGVEMRPLTDQELEVGQQGVTSAESLHKEGLTVVPAAERDFRGTLGDIERATRAYKNMEGHSHSSPLMALPLYRLMTWIEPTFEEGWRTGGAVLAMGTDPHQHELAIDFLMEGLKANPKSLMILNQIGFTLAVKKKDYGKAIPIFEQARNIGLHTKVMNEADQESFRDVYRWLTLLYRETNQPEKQQMVATEGLKIFPDDVVLSKSGEAQMPTHKDEEDHHDHDH